MSWTSDFPWSFLATGFSLPSLNSWLLCAAFPGPAVLCTLAAACIALYLAYFKLLRGRRIYALVTLVYVCIYIYVIYIYMFVYVCI